MKEWSVNLSRCTVRTSAIVSVLARTGRVSCEKRASGVSRYMDVQHGPPSLPVHCVFQSGFSSFHRGVHEYLRTRSKRVRSERTKREEGEDGITVSCAQR